MRSHFVPACCIINNKGECTLFHCVLLCVGHETRDKVSYLTMRMEIRECQQNLDVWIWKILKRLSENFQFILKLNVFV